MSTLVIVESPAKAKTISQYLGHGYEVLASYGHIRDLPESADDIPADMKKHKWAKLGVNVEEDFEPLYIVPSDKKRQVDTLKKASVGKTRILLATDEDREGESISWHILQVLKPKKGVEVKRIVFHEITPEAIQDAVASPRAVDENLVKAQETRRILDRLYGYSLSPVLWKKVAPRLSAGRVQSVAVRLTVMRERERRSFVSATYWDLEADLKAKNGPISMKLQAVGGERLVSGTSFDPTTGKQTGKGIWLQGSQAESLKEEATSAKPWKVVSVETNPGTERPPVPFMTSTLQQEANRKLKFTSKRTMQIAQSLYEGIEMGGQREGLITYMRTDSLHLADRAVAEARTVIADLYGKEYLPAKPNTFKTKNKGAQEAHEAIRPTHPDRRPQDVAKYLDRDQLALYDLIWKRTIACQMVPAQVERTTVLAEVPTSQGNLQFHASGKSIRFAGFLRAYVEGSDDPDAELDGREKILPVVEVGEVLDLKELTAESHTTKPPARFTEASLVKRLEEEGIGRPSTYASIISTIQDRGYVRKSGNELIPTFMAFAVTELLEDHFTELVDLKFTAEMEENLDEIADGKRQWVKELRNFYVGTEQHPGLELQIKTRQEEIPYPALKIGDAPSGEPIVVRVGRFGTYLQRGEGGPGNTAPIPDDVAPADLTLENALILIETKGAGPAAVGVHSATGKNVFFKSGRYGDYLEVEDEGAEKPHRVTLPKELKGVELAQNTIDDLLKFPRDLGPHPESKEPVLVAIGQYGSYVKCGPESRNVEDWRNAVTMSLEDAMTLLSQPKGGRAARGSGGSVSAIHEFGPVEGLAGPVRVLPGRFGPYVTDGKTNATIPKSISPETITQEQAVELIKAKMAAGPSTFKRKKVVKRTTSKKK